MNNLFVGICIIIRWLLIACVLPIWYIGAIKNNSIKSEDAVVLGIFSIIWVLTFLKIVFVP